MKTTLTILIIFVFLQNLFCQVEKVSIILTSGDKIDTISKFNISETQTHYYKADLSPWTVLKDSGAFNGQHEKVGIWKEYPIDTTALNSKDNVKEQSSLSEIYRPNIVKLEGKYINGQRDGIWKKYSANLRTQPYFWNLDVTSEYEKNQKNGKEVFFEPFTNDTMMVFIYKDNEPIKQIK